MFIVCSGQKNIVMLGNSLTNRISWNELLGRDDVANRGIGSDITAGFTHRINFAFNVNPKTRKLNIEIKKLATIRKIDLIDLNPRLTDGDFLRPENAIADGIHFTSKAYKIWKEEIIKILVQEKM